MTANAPPNDFDASVVPAEAKRAAAAPNAATVLRSYTAIDPANDAVAKPEDAARPSARVADASGAEAAPDEAAEDERTVLRIEHLPRDVGWMMVYVGVLGVILPGVVGAPFLVARIAVLAPGGPQRCRGGWAASRVDWCTPVSDRSADGSTISSAATPACRRPRHDAPPRPRRPVTADVEEAHFFRHHARGAWPPDG